MSKSIFLLLAFVAAASALKYEIEFTTGSSDFKPVKAHNLYLTLENNFRKVEFTLHAPALIKKESSYSFFIDYDYQIGQITGVVFGWNIHKLPTPDSPNPIAFKNIRLIPSYYGNGTVKKEKTKTYCLSDQSETLGHDHWAKLSNC